MAAAVTKSLADHTGRLDVLQLTLLYLKCNRYGFMRTWEHVKERRNVKKINKIKKKRKERKKSINPDNY